ncbi:MAG: hypothetical protein COT17_08010, partial [Elusimicrobia bacterium CG08_land_8_20_14_0_20_51_18]
MRFDAEYALYLNEKPEEEGPGYASAEEETFGFFPRKAQPIQIPWTQIADMSFTDYKASFRLAPDKRLEIKALGYKFEDFSRLASKLRNENLIKTCLARETLKKSMIEAEISFSKDGKEVFREACELRIYETSLLALPQTHEFLRFPFRFIKEISEGDYLLKISSEKGESLEISGLGKNFDHFRESLYGQMNELDSLVQKNLSALFQGAAAPLSVRAAAKILKEGKIAKLSRAEEKLPGLLSA